MDWDRILRKLLFDINYAQLSKKQHQMNALMDLYFLEKKGGDVFLKYQVHEALWRRGLVEQRTRWTTCDELTTDGHDFVHWIWNGGPTFKGDADGGLPVQGSLF